MTLMGRVLFDVVGATLGVGIGALRLLGKLFAFSTRFLFVV
jgi:hypothetical protein